MSDGKTDLISFVIPVYNVEKYLKECMKSLINQTYSNYEIVVVDDCSTDASLSIAETFSKLDKRIRIVRHDRNRGLAAARNTGIESARGKYIAFVDSDDFVAPDYLSHLYAIVVEQGVQVAVCGRYLYYKTAEGEKLMREASGSFCGERLSNLEAIRAINCYRAFDVSMCSKLIDANLFEGIVFPEGYLCEDFYVCHKILFKADSLFYDPSPLYYYRQRPGSISRGKTINMAPVAASDEQLKFIESNCPELTKTGITGCVFARISISNEYTRRSMAFPQEKSYRSYVVKGVPAVFGNGDISMKKKIQALCYAIAPAIYKKVFMSFSERAKLQESAIE